MRKSYTTLDLLFPVKDIPVIKATVNGITGYCIIDTGGTDSMFAQSLTQLKEKRTKKDYFLYKLKKYFYQRSGIGLGRLIYNSKLFKKIIEKTQEKNVVIITYTNNDIRGFEDLAEIEIKGKKERKKVIYTPSIEGLIGEYEVIGLLGMDFLRDSIIDLAGKKLYINF